MNNNGNHKALESYKIFPIIAWALVIAFALFVYSIALRLQAVADNLEAQTMSLQHKVNAAPGEIVDFEN